MFTIFTILFFISWMVCGIISVGFVIGELQNDWGGIDLLSRIGGFLYVLLALLAGPCSLLIIYIRRV